MSTAARMAGPWELTTNPHSVVVRLGPDVPGTDEIELRLYGEGDDDGTIAIARLIAAAPELLTALGMLIANLAAPQAIEDARAAIAKAT